MSYLFYETSERANVLDPPAHSKLFQLRPHWRSSLVAGNDIQKILATNRHISS